MLRLEQKGNTKKKENSVVGKRPTPQGTWKLFAVGGKQEEDAKMEC